MMNITIQKIQSQLTILGKDLGCSAEDMKYAEFSYDTSDNGENEISVVIGDIDDGADYIAKFNPDGEFKKLISRFYNEITHRSCPNEEVCYLSSKILQRMVDGADRVETAGVAGFYDSDNEPEFDQEDLSFLDSVEA